jgi:hypothetical protein
LIQRDFLWGRHSHAWVIEHPTCPVEWQQATPFLGYQDFMATGQVRTAVLYTKRGHCFDYGTDSPVHILSLLSQ